jgi:hypothetical protein
MGAMGHPPRLHAPVGAFHTLLKLMYRVIAPGHPRGWVVVIADDRGFDGAARVYTQGMAKRGLSELEIDAVPKDLGGYAHGMLFNVMGYMKSTKVRPDEHIGGLFHSDSQRCATMFTFRDATEPNGSAFLRLVDKGAAVDDGFPRKAFASHLTAIADGTREPGAASHLYRRAIELQPGIPPEEVSGGDDFDRSINHNGFLAWDGLASRLLSAGRVDDGVACLRQAVARCAPFGRGYREFVKSQAEAEPRFRQDPVVRAWIDLDVEAAISTTKLTPTPPRA